MIEAQRDQEKQLRLIEIDADVQLDTLPQAHVFYNNWKNATNRGYASRYRDIVGRGKV